VEYLKDPKACHSHEEVDVNTLVIIPGYGKFKVGERFWTSWCQITGQSRNVFDMFQPEEVFSRLNDDVRITVEINDTIQDGQPDGTILACASSKRQPLTSEDMQAAADKFGAEFYSYDKGVVTALFNCPFPTTYELLEHKYTTQFLLQVPVDGFSQPASYLALHRIQDDGRHTGIVITPMCKESKTILQVGVGNVQENLFRVISTFNPEEEFHKLIGRLEIATASWASFGEACGIFRLLTTAMRDSHVSTNTQAKILERFDQLCGDPNREYNLTSRQEVSTRRAMTIPVRCMVYDLIAFMADAGAETSDDAAMAIYRWMGMIYQEFELEGSQKQFPTWESFQAG